MRAGEAITAEEAVRRVLILENPALRGQSAITQSLYAGPATDPARRGGAQPPPHPERTALHRRGCGRLHRGGRRAHHHAAGRLHHHAQSWTWHDHGHEAEGPVVWLDGLDIPMIRFFDAGFAENDTAKSQQVKAPEGTSFARYGHNMAPVRGESPFGADHPIFSYPYRRSREALHQLERDAPVDAWDGIKLRYINPLTGGSPMPTMATFMQTPACRLYRQALAANRRRRVQRGGGPGTATSSRRRR